MDELRVTPARVLAAARAAHEVNRIYCMTIGDNSQPTWDDAPTWQKDSAIAGVEGVLAGNGPEESHASWLKHKEADGWIWGPTKNPTTKTHPCMVPYAELPPEQRKKDHIYVAVVRVVLAAFEDTNA